MTEHRTTDDPLETDRISRARRLRRNSTEPEAYLWRHLRNRSLIGAKFRRQYPIGRYYLDFFCMEKKLAIELDGGQHYEPKNLAYDYARSAPWASWAFAYFASRTPISGAIPAQRWRQFDWLSWTKLATNCL